MKNVLNAILVDTNMLVYVYDPRDRAKQDRAIFVLDQLFEAERAVLSVQCLTEFFNIATRRRPKPMTREDAVVRIEKLVRVCRILSQDDSTRLLKDRM